MVLTTKVYVEHPDLALSHTIRSLPDVEIGVIPDAGTDPEHDVHFFWIEASDFDAVDATLTEDHTVEDFSVIVDDGSRRTYRIEYSDSGTLLTPGIVDVDGLTLESKSHSNGWRLHLQLKDQDALLALNEYASQEDIRLDILKLQQRERDNDRVTFGLTGSQREALVGAFVHGYYDDPREVSQEDLASILGISPSAVSGRLRRGSARLIEEFLIDDDSD